VNTAWWNLTGTTYVRDIWGGNADFNEVLLTKRTQAVVVSFSHGPGFIYL